MKTLSMIVAFLACLLIAAPAEANGGIFSGGLFRRNNVRVKEVVQVRQQVIQVKEVRQVVQQKVVQQVVQQKVFAAPLYVAPVQAYVQQAYVQQQAYCPPAAFSVPYQAPVQSQTFAEVQAKSKLLELELQILQLRQSQMVPVK